VVGGASGSGGEELAVVLTNEKGAVCLADGLDVSIT